MRNERLFKVGKNLVKFAWTIEIIAVLIGFLISIIVSYSVFNEINRFGKAFTFGDYAAILVAGLPFLLVAVVEATKIPIATAMMYAKHRPWKYMLFFGVILLSLITFETMINGFERNFANLTFAIDERKSQSLLLQHSIDNIEEQKRKIDTIKIDKVENTYANRVARANKNYNEQISHQSQYISQQLNGMDDSYKAKIDRELNSLYAKESKIYESWDKERESMQKRLRNLLNQNVSGANKDKDKLAREVDSLKREMKIKMADSTFLTRGVVERKYRKLISEKEKRLYAVSDYATGTKALDQQTGTEKQLQEQLSIVGKTYQKRVDAIHSRIDYLNSQLKKQQNSNDFLQTKYRKELENFTLNAAKNKTSLIRRAANAKNSLYNKYSNIQTKMKDHDTKIFELKKEQTSIHYEMNRLVNQNQVYRVASYISSKENGMDVPHELVGLVALIWFASLAFISSVTGVFLAIAGIYIQKCYDPELNEKTVV
jgi:tetrahydromethanopterin S-methyltransferase subunit B